MAIQPVPPTNVYTADQVLRGHRAAREPDARIGENREPPASGPERHDDRDDKHAGKTRGVIRLLEAGHFKGVADVRLRINFFDELQARAAEQSVEVARERVAGLNEQVDAQYADLLAGRDLDQTTLEAAQALRAEFGESLDAALQGFSDSHDVASLGASIESAFDDFVSELRTLLGSQTGDAAGEPDGGPAGDAVTPGIPAPIDESPESNGEFPSGGLFGAVQVSGDQPDKLRTATANADRAVDLTVADDAQTRLQPDDLASPEAGPTQPEADPFAAFVAAFEQALGGILEDIETAGRLADPKPRHHQGHPGRAYEKFLAIYNELRGISVDEAV